MVNIAGMKSLIAVNEKDYKFCIDAVEHNESINSLKAKLRFHHLKFDGNGRPMTKALAGLLYNYIIDYCIAAKNRPAPISFTDAARLTKEARKLFRNPDITDDSPDKTGEAGEALLYFLIEAIIQAPQIVAKMELKTNRKLESNGSDGIHARWNEDDNVVDFYFGESKLYQDMGDAISSAIKSIEGFHTNEIYKHEFTMITKHFKYADEEVQKAVTEHIELGEPGPGARINHACLIGYNWDEYSCIPNGSSAALTEEFKRRFTAATTLIAKTLDKKLEKFSKKHLHFDVFFMPLPSVQEFRDEFNAALK